MKDHFLSIEKVKNLREIQALKRLTPHPNIVRLLEVLYDEPTGRLALVFELMDMNLYDSINGKKTYLPEQKVKSQMYSILKGIDHMHRNGIFHRDIKPENILLLEDQIKIADFGSWRGLYSKQPFTEYISTRWYRAPEWLLTDGYYGYKMDLWGLGWVFFEVLCLYPLFPGNNELDQISKIHDIMGTPKPELLEGFAKHATHMEVNFPEKIGTGIAPLLKHVSKNWIDLLEKLLLYDPDDRITASQALKHAYFKDLRENDARYAFSTTQPLIYNNQNSDKDGGSSKMANKKKPKRIKNASEIEELPPIKKKDPKKFGSYGKTMLFSKKKNKNKFVSPYTKKKLMKYNKPEQLI